MFPQIVYEDNHLLVANKPAGLLSQGDQTGDESIVEVMKGYVKHRYNKPGNVYLGLVHRLDRPVSGCLIMAKTSKGLTRMNEQFQSKKVTKEYLAITESRLPNDSGTMHNFLIKDKSKNRAKVVKNKISGAKDAATNYLLIGRLENRFIYLLKPQTGRPHQLRVQMAHRKCAINGDTKYSSRVFLDGHSIALHCFKMTFTHPTKKEEIVVKSYPKFTQEWQIFKGLIKSL